MRLIIKDYLLQLKEKDELDLLLCDILLQKGYITENRPETGNRQYGVDIRAHKEDEILLCVVKQGNLTRKNWCADQNAVRQSLDEIHDCYLDMFNIADPKKKLRIAVVTNGMMDEAVGPMWEGYKRKNKIWDGMRVDLEFWNIDTLTDLAKKHMFDEHIFSTEMQALLRRALYFIGEGEYRRTYFEQIINEFIARFDTDDSVKVRNKKLAGVYLASQMIAQYAVEEGIYKIGIMVSEYLLIRYWKYMLEHNLFEKTPYVDWLIEYLSAYEKWNQKYHEAVSYCCEGKKRLPFSNPVSQNVMLFEMLGYLTSYGYYLASKSECDSSVHEKCQAVCNSIIQLINHYPQLLYPSYDVHIGTISMLYRFLNSLGRSEDVNTRMYDQCVYLVRYYRSFKKYPSSADSFEDAMNIHMGFTAEEYVTSAFWGTMLEWIVLMDQKSLYEMIQPFLAKDLSDVTKCTWFFRAEDELKLYDDHAMHRAGEGVSIEAEESFAELKENVDFIMKQYEKETFSFETYSFDALEFIVCRYYGYLARVKR